MRYIRLLRNVTNCELDPDGFDRYIFPDYEFRLCKGKERAKQRLMRDFPNREKETNKFFTMLEKITKAVSESMSVQSGRLGSLSFLLKHPVLVKYSRVPFQRLLDEVTSDTLLQAVLAAPCGTYGLPPAKASVIVAMVVWNHYFDGAYYPQGGSGALRDAFTNALTKHGAEIKNLSRVVSIDRKEGEFLVQTQSGEIYTALSIISNADPAITLGTLVKANLVPYKIRQKVKRLRPSLAVFYAFVGTDLDLPSLGMTGANIHHYEDIDLNKIYNSQSVPHRVENVDGFFITSPSVKDPAGKHAPPNRHTLEIVRGISYESFARWAAFPSGKRGEDYEFFKKHIGEGLLKAAEKYIPDLSGHLEYVEYATPLSSEYWVNAVKGGCYGPEQSPDQMGPGRFSDFASGIDGLFLAGAGTIGGGIMPCVLSGIRSAKKASEFLKSSRR
ncbi:MAG: hypothetical protein DRH11_09050 [Deltaproteobacteria bacterium]|nr:MAG: hypothetical protein DRH11_09050 [Deltaproteobacteria bacterium]